jgi:hypothetical protein
VYNRRKRLVSFRNNREQLRSNIIIPLSKTIGDKPGIGWLRGNTVASEDILSQLNDSCTAVERLRLENDDLKSQMVPKVDNIATLNETFNIRYGDYDDDGRNKRNGILDISWAEIFKIIGPSFFSPHQQGTIESSLKGEIRHRSGRSRSLGIFDGDVDTIKIQMAAYGFMTIYSGNSVQGGVSEYMQLTEFGKRVLVELAAVKAASAYDGRHAMGLRNLYSFGGSRLSEEIRISSARCCL